MNKKTILLVFIFFTYCYFLKAESFSIIDYDYNQTVSHSNMVVNDYYKLYSKLKTTASSNEKMEFLANYLVNLNIPYGFVGAMGEGDQLTTVQQDPIYRFDVLNCITLVQNVMALFVSKNIETFKQNLIDISYGAYDNTNNITYLNRNNFISTDFNIINSNNGKLLDVTALLPFKVISANINHRAWFNKQAENENIKNSVRLLPKNLTNKAEIINFFKNDYAKDFKEVHVDLKYIPKEELVIKKGTSYSINEALINSIPTPAVVEFVRTPHKWIIKGKTIKEVTGSDILVSHVGILYKKTFNKGEVIYQKTTCENKDTNCIVTPVICNKDNCTKIMMLVATDSYPNNFIYSYNKTTNSYSCTLEEFVPSDFKKINNCNRVLEIPLGEYLATQNYGRYIYMESESLIGINIQKIN